MLIKFIKIIYSLVAWRYSGLVNNVINAKNIASIKINDLNKAINKASN